MTAPADLVAAEVGEWAAIEDDAVELIDEARAKRGHPKRVRRRSE